MKLLTITRTFTHKHDDTVQGEIALVNHYFKLYMHCQLDKESIVNFCIKFMVTIKVVKTQAVSQATTKSTTTP